TRRHAFLVSMLGIKEIIVAINKMDMIDFREEVFQNLKTDVSKLLTSLDFVTDQYIPISAMEGDNIYNRSTRTDWYQGPTLIQALDLLEEEEVTEKPLRFIVQDVYENNTGKIIAGRVESGTLRKGDELVFQPSGEKGKVDSIIHFPHEIEMASAGDVIGIKADCKPRRGDVGGYQVQPPVPVDEFLGEVVLRSETGEVLGTSTGEIGKNDAAELIFRTEPLVVEPFSDIPELGRFILAKEMKNVGAGVVLETGG
ncbi:MAG: EF-Tu/IF-2/RF-3 family GTPase, partial [Dehalococcoidia bacterium]